MKKASNQSAGSKPPRKKSSATVATQDFDDVLHLIKSARTHAVAAVNTTLIQLYWSIGEFIAGKIAEGRWGHGTVQSLSEHIRKSQPNARGFSASNLWRMTQFFETYRHLPILATLSRELPWSHNLAILSRSKRDEEREFYLRMATQQHWSFRELQRQLNGALFERVALSPAKHSVVLKETHPTAATVFKDSYLVEFLDLAPNHSENDLQQGLVEQLKNFLIELGRDFCYVGSQYPLQVGGRDFALDLLFFNRALNCLVAIELKIVEFEPEHLGKLQFYLEALDRDVRKPHEQPTIGVLLCATKNHEVVEYVLSRTASPALVAEYQTRMPDKKLLQHKLHEFYELAESQSLATSQLESEHSTQQESAAAQRKSHQTKRKNTSQKRKR